MKQKSQDVLEFPFCIFKINIFAKEIKEERFREDAWRLMQKVYWAKKIFILKNIWFWILIQIFGSDVIKIIKPKRNFSDLVS